MSWGVSGSRYADQHQAVPAVCQCAVSQHIDRRTNCLPFPFGLRRQEKTGVQEYLWCSRVISFVLEVRGWSLMTLKCTTEIKWEKWFETVSVSLWRVWRNCFDPDRRYKRLTLQLSELAPSVRFLQKWCESLPPRWKVRTSKGQDPKCVMDSRRWDFRSPQRQPSYWHSRQRMISTVQANPFPSEITSSFLNILSPVPENIYWSMCLS